MSVVLLSHHLKSEKLLDLDFKAVVYTFMRLLNVFNEDIFTEKPPQLWHLEMWRKSIFEGTCEDDLHIKSFFLVSRHIALLL